MDLIDERGDGVPWRLAARTKCFLSPSTGVDVAIDAQHERSAIRPADLLKKVALLRKDAEMTFRTSPSFVLITSLVLAATALACSPHSDVPLDAQQRSDSGPEPVPDAGTDAGLVGPVCTPELENYIYLFDDLSRLLRFQPRTKTVEVIGQIDCRTGGNPYSMAVSRNGVAYVLLTSRAGSGGIGLFEVDITDASCLGQTDFEPTPTFDTFGMGFSTDSDGSTSDSLYISGMSLGRVDTQTWTVTEIGPITGAPEMSGNARGELWGFVAWSDPPRVMQIDKTTAALSNEVSLDALNWEISQFAFSYWGGDFYLFAAPGSADGGSGATAVYRLSGGALELHVPAGELGDVRVVGAASSTCVPLI